MPTRRKKRSAIENILAVLSIIILVMLLLRFDAVAKVVDPSGKLGVQNFANDAFPILLGALLAVIGIATIASVWVSAALIIVGVITIIGKAVSIYNRTPSTPDLTQN